MSIPSPHNVATLESDITTLTLFLHNVYRECNQVVNRLAAMAMGRPSREVRLYHALPRELEEVLIHDQMSLRWPRRVCNS